jgi:shikimate dehydrogenase
VWNRTPERARALASDLGVEAVTRITPANFLVNCTPVGLNGVGGVLKELPVGADEISMFGTVIDLAYSYSAGETALLAAARRAGKPTVDGLELLASQGALSFERFTGRVAPLELMRAAARAAER